MSIFTGIIVYLMIFWTSLFVVLPWGNKAEVRVPEEGISGAPISPRVKQKFLATFALSAVLWVIVYILVEMKVIDFHAISVQMTEKDFGE